MVFKFKISPFPCPYIQYDDDKSLNNPWGWHQKQKYRQMYDIRGGQLIINSLKKKCWSLLAMPQCFSMGEWWLKNDHGKVCVGDG